MASVSDKYYCVFNGKKYAFDFSRLEELFVSLNGQDNREKEITESYALNDRNEMELNGKINRETKVYGIPQNRLLTYDIIKMFLERILNDDAMPDDPIDASLSLALNSLLNLGVLTEIKESKKI